MNADDIKLMNEILYHIDHLNNGNKMLFLVDYGRIAKTNLLLLKGLLEELKKNGLLVTVDRPHLYMEHLLRMHKVNYSNLFFLDTITTFSGAVFTQNDNLENVKVLDSPFQIDLLPELFSFSNKNVGFKNQIDISGLDFIMIDNVASMLNYNDLETVESFLENYFNRFNEINRIFLPLIMDKLIHGSLYMSAKKWFDKEIDINLLRKENSRINMDTGDLNYPSQHKKILDLYNIKGNFNGGD